MKIIQFKADFEIELSRNLYCSISFDENLDSLAREEKNGAGTEYLMSRVRFDDRINAEKIERMFWFPIDRKISCLRDLFVNELWLIVRSFKKFQCFDWVTKSNPECAWLFYKKTFDAVIGGTEILENSKFTAQIVCEHPDGKKIELKHLEDGTERLFMDGTYLGRVDTILGDNNYVQYSDCAVENMVGPLFVCDLKVNKQYPEGSYQSILGSKELFIENGVHIWHKGSFADIAKGVVEAAEKFISIRE